MKMTNTIGLKAILNHNETAQPNDDLLNTLKAVIPQFFDKDEIEELLISLFSNDELFIKPVTVINNMNIKSDSKTATVETGGYMAVKSLSGNKEKPIKEAWKEKKGPG
jgi:hypothetical protein